MSRAPRDEVPYGCYHVHTRGNDRRDIYFGNWSGRLFVRELSRASLRHGWRIAAYCLMTNHYHVVLRIGDSGLSEGMCELNGRFARSSNRMLKRSDHLFGGRFTGSLVEEDSYFLEVTRYVLLNPVRAGLTRDARRWRWSSMRSTLGLDVPAPGVDVGWVLGSFGRTPRQAKEVFGRFVDDGVGRPRPDRKTRAVHQRQ